MKELIENLEKLWVKYRPKRRIWVTLKYGGVVIEDNRTMLEKIRDYIDNIFEKIKTNELRFSISKHVWHTYFDYSTGQWIDSSTKIKDMERAGYTYTTFSEMEKHCTVRKKERKEELRKKMRAGLVHKIKQIEHGKSFIPKLPREKIIIHS